MKRGRLALAAALGLLTGGCKIIDQTTFGAKPEPPPPDLIAEALKPGSTVPLVAIRFDGTPINYDAALKNALDMAQTRKPDAKYRVVTVVPQTGDPAKDSAAIEKGTYDVLRLEDAMMSDGIRFDDISVAARAEKGVTAREIRIYVQ
jgi:hypothetical protein